MRLNDGTLLFCIPIGDWSEDGHNRSKNILVRANKSIEEMREAYKKSCKLVGVQFNDPDAGDGNYADLQQTGHMFDPSLVICCDSDQSTLSEEQYNKLKAFDCPFDALFDGFDPNDLDDSNLGPEGFAKLILWFISLSLPEFTYEVINLPVLNGYWEKGFNHSFGYGLF